MRRLAILTVVAVLLASCAGTTTVVTDADIGAIVEIGSGDEFEIRLDSNPSTGFGWQVVDVTDRDAVTVGPATYVAPDSDLVGVFGTEVFRVEGREKGAGIIRLEYVRSFDDPQVPERVAEFIVRVDGAPWPPPAPEPPATSTAAAPFEIGALLDERPVGTVEVAGFMVWDGTSARLCELLMESFPPQCGGAAVEISDPEAYTGTLDEAQGVRWTAGRVVVNAALVDGRLLLAG